jgi:hypothetical protein
MNLNKVYNNRDIRLIYSCNLFFSLQKRIGLAIVTGCWWLSAAGGPLTGLVGTAAFVWACAQYEEAVDNAWKLYWTQGGTEQR